MPGETNQTRILHALGPACMMIGDIADQTGIPRSDVSQAAALLIGRGYVERVERGCFQLTTAGHQAVAEGVRIETGVTGPTRALRKPKPTSIRQRAWNAMRVARTFTVADIVAASAGPDDGNVVKNLRHYFNALAKAGYLSVDHRRQRGTAPSSPGFMVFRLIRDSGRLAPQVSVAHGKVHDFNEVQKCTRR